MLVNLVFPLIDKQNNNTSVTCQTAKEANKDSLTCSNPSSVMLLLANSTLLKMMP
jgi:hypothetical protein